MSTGVIHTNNDSELITSINGNTTTLATNVSHGKGIAIAPVVNYTALLSCAAVAGVNECNNACRDYGYRTEWKIVAGSGAHSCMYAIHFYYRFTIRNS